MDFGLRGKVAAITGGSEGIGRATALLFAELGAKISICARRAEVLERTATEIRKKGAEVITVCADASKADDVVRFVEQTVEYFGRIDIVVNNAGSTGQSPFTAVDDAAWKKRHRHQGDGPCVDCPRRDSPYEEAGWRTHHQPQHGGRQAARRRAVSDRCKPCRGTCPDQSLVEGIGREQHSGPTPWQWGK